MPAREPRVHSHARFESAVRFDLTLTCRTGFHIGAGKNAALVGSDLPVLRDADGLPLIPGSSLRGVLRSGVEALCTALELDARLAQAPAEDGLPEELVRLWNSMPAVHRLFGRIGTKAGELAFGSRVQISDCRCADPGVAVELRDGVSIGRETRTAAAAVGGKFDVEVVPAGTRFAGTVRLLNADDYEVGLIAQALWMLDEGMLLLGGKSARGLGWMEVRVGAPHRITARELLTAAGRSRPTNGAEPATVSEHLGSYLDALAALADSPPLAPTANDDRAVH